MTDLYRFFDADGTLLYVGISFSAVARASQHRTQKGWWQDVARMDIEHYDTRQDAEKAERHAIRAERPLHNVLHNCLSAVEETSCREYVPITMLASLLGITKPGKGSDCNIWGSSDAAAFEAARFAVETLGLDVRDGYVNGGELNKAWDDLLAESSAEMDVRRRRNQLEQIQRIVALDIVRPHCRAVTSFGAPCRNRSVTGLCRAHQKHRDDDR